MPCGTFQANATFFAIGELTYNLYLGFRSIALGKKWERTQVQTVRWRLFQTAGKIVRHGRLTFLKINSAMLAVFTAIRSVACASCRKDASCQKRHDHECGILAFAGANLMVWAVELRPERPKSLGMRSKLSSQGIAHRRRPLGDMTMSGFTEIALQSYRILYP